jgi:hypothetical protein
MAKAEKFIQGMRYDDFLADDKTSYATLRALEIIGEAVKKVPKVIRNRYPDIPWAKSDPDLSVASTRLRSWPSLLPSEAVSPLPSVF